jgi:hypothetical protein
MHSQPSLVHHVFFWLKRPDSPEDLAQLLNGIRGLTAIEQVRQFHVGVPASTTPRDVVETTYDASELLFFDSVEDQEAYQNHPLHKKFVAEHAHLWAKVVVYDSLQA